MIETLAGATSRTMLKVMEEGIRAVGNEIDGGGQPLSAELILDAWEKVHIDFECDGRPQWPTIMIHPSQQARLIAELSRLDADPELRGRREEGGNNGRIRRPVCTAAEPIPEFRPPFPRPCSLHGNRQSLPLPNDHYQPLAARHPRVDQVALQHWIVLGTERDDDGGIL